MLYFSSYAMGVAGFYSAVNKEPLLGGLLLASYGTSILHHANYTNTNYLGGPWVAWMDRVLARACWVVSVYKLYPLPLTWRTVISWLAAVSSPLAYFLIIYTYTKPYRPFVVSKRILLHACFLHILPSISVVTGMTERRRVLG